MTQSDWHPINLVWVVADSIEQLRSCDLYRLLDLAATARDRMADYVIQYRPDLLSEVQSVMEELNDATR